MSPTVEIGHSYLWIAHRNEFLTNYNNKEKIVNTLAAKLEGSSVKPVLCSSDADTTIVKTELQHGNKPVAVFSDGTDILCYLLHHLYFPRNQNKIHFMDTTCKSDTEERACYRVQDFIDVSKNIRLKYIRSVRYL